MLDLVKYNEQLDKKQEHGRTLQCKLEASLGFFSDTSTTDPNLDVHLKTAAEKRLQAIPRPHN